jgi:survival of motor neuron-related-splicing factor 30
MEVQVNVKLYRFQLEQVQNLLESDPNNQNLLFLKEKIERLLKVLERNSNDDIQRSRESGKIGDHAIGDSIPVFNIGDMVEAKYHKDNQWWEAKIQSLASDRSMFTVLFTGFPDPQHCSPKEVRLHNPSSTRVRPNKIIHHAKRPIIPSKEIINPKRNKATKQEYLEKKETEQREKQESWKSFQQKIKKKN